MALRGGFQKDVFQGKMFSSIGCNCSPIFHAVFKAGWCRSAHQGEGWFPMKLSSQCVSGSFKNLMSPWVHFQLR